MQANGTLAFGQKAKKNFDEQRSIRSIKSVLCSPKRALPVDWNITAEQIAIMLFRLLKQGAATTLGQQFSKAVITVPANSTGLTRHATRLCAGAAGIQVLALVNEATAAAISYGLDCETDQNVLVYDLGGRTLDVTILHVHDGNFEVVSNVSIALGGDDIDRVIATHIAGRFESRCGYDIMSSRWKQRFMLAVEEAKIQLSDQRSAMVRVEGELAAPHSNLAEEIDRKTVEREIMPLIAGSGAAIDQAIRLAGLVPKQLQRVLLVGGSCRVPLVRRYVAEKTGIEPERFDNVDPMSCVAQGAAIVSAILQSAPGVEAFRYAFRLEHSICFPRVNAEGRPYLEPILKRGFRIPCSFSDTIYPATDPADRVLISLYEGDDYENPESLENVYLAEIPWEFKPRRAKHDGRLEVTAEFGCDGILAVTIHDLYAGSRKRFAIQQTSANHEP
jgi:molecular chaperone DnaK